jgi:hypothetical protein
MKRLLTAMGWNVKTVPYWEWHDLRTPEEKMLCIEEILGI